MNNENDKQPERRSENAARSKAASMAVASRKARNEAGLPATRTAIEKLADNPTSLRLAVDAKALRTQFEVVR